MSSVVVTPSRRREGRAFGTVALGGAGLAAIIVAIAVALWMRFVRYDRIAARHVPPESVLAVRLDVQQQAIYDPVRRHLLPLLGSPSRPAPEGDARLARFEAVTGLERGDLRELVYARSANAAEWVVVLSGLFPRGVGAPLIGTALGGDGAPFRLSPDGRTVLGPDGLAIARAADGAVVIASSMTELARALPDSPRAAALGLLPRGPGSAGAVAPVLGEAGALLPPGSPPELAGDVAALERVEAAVTLGERIGVTLTAHGATAAAARQTAERTLEMLRTFGRTGDGPVAELFRSAADRARLGPGGDRSATLEIAWEPQEVDHAVDLVAEAIRFRFQ